MAKQTKSFLEWVNDEVFNGNCQYRAMIDGYIILTDANGFSRGNTCVHTCEYLDKKVNKKIVLEADSQLFKGTKAYAAFQHLLAKKANGEFTIVNPGSAWERATFNQDKYAEIMGL